jgi:hypothetical protein
VRPRLLQSPQPAEDTSVKLYGADDRELLEVSSLQRAGGELLVKGRVLGTLPLSARLRPEEARAALRMMDWRTRWFVFTLLFRSSHKG